MIHSIAYHFDTLASVKAQWTGVYISHAVDDEHAYPSSRQASRSDGERLYPVLTGLRLVKDAEEIKRLAAAGQVADVGMAAAMEAVRPGATESEIAGAAEFAMRKAGAEGIWRSYISSGPRTNVAHGLPTTRVLQAGDLAMIDIHPIVDGYSADICRMASLGKATASSKRHTICIFRRAGNNRVRKSRRGNGRAGANDARGA